MTKQGKAKTAQEIQAEWDLLQQRRAASVASMPKPRTKTAQEIQAEQALLMKRIALSPDKKTVFIDNVPYPFFEWLSEAVPSWARDWQYPLKTIRINEPDISVQTIQIDASSEVRVVVIGEGFALQVDSWTYHLIQVKNTRPEHHAAFQRIENAVRAAIEEVAKRSPYAPYQG